MTRVKICGITSVADALSVAQAGADAIGLVFYEKSSRFVSIEKAEEICAALPPFITTVALFMNADQEYVTQITTRIPFDLLQFHGEESPEFCRSFGRPYIKAVAMKGLDDFASYADRFDGSKGFLVDSHAPGDAGGSGLAFDWNTIPVDYGAPIILAGGLHPGNVGQALRSAKVYAVDVSSGVDQSPGVKDPVKIQQFMQEVRRVDHET